MAFKGKGKVATLPVTKVNAAADMPPVASAPGVRTYTAGQIISSKYELIRLLGEGGMGSVWLAENLALEVEVAIKLVRTDRAGAKASARLMQEAKAAARLEHPSTVKVFDFGTTDSDDPFLVMEVVRGESLASKLDRRGRIDPVRAVQLLLPVASALAAAHAKGIIHRDVKPGNIILMAAETGVVVPKLVDFGIAKVREKQGKRKLTMDGQVLGSPEYMSPEQAKALEVDERSDVWSLAVIVYECIVGRRPFEGDSFAEVLSAILKDDPEPTTELGAGDAALWEIIARGLEKKREDRWRTVQRFGTALAAWAVERGIEHDITGASLRMSWLSEGEGYVVESVPPPRVSGPPPEGRARQLSPMRHVSPGGVIRPFPTTMLASAPDTAPPPSPRTWSPRQVAAVVGAGAIAFAGYVALSATSEPVKPQPASIAATAQPLASKPTTGEVAPPPMPSESAVATPALTLDVPPPAAAPPPRTQPVKPRGKPGPKKARTGVDALGF